MNIKEFFKPTKGKLIAPIILLLWTIYYDLFSPIFGKATFFERLISMITNIPHLIFVVIFILVIYFISCSIAQFVNKSKK